LQSIDRGAFDAVLNARLTEKSQRHDDAIAVDGKSLRGSGHGRRKRPVQLLAALGHATGQVLGQVDVDIKTNETQKIKDLLDLLDIMDKIVTTDGLHTQVETARYLVEDKHAHYIMEVKKNRNYLAIPIGFVQIKVERQPNTWKK